MSAPLAARLFAGLIAVVIAFQLALALGAPWGEFAMGGAFPGAFPPAMRVVAVVQAVLLGVFALIVLSRAGLILPRWRAASRWLTWVLVGLLTLSAVLNLITPSAPERMVWGPVALLLLATAARVAVAK